MARETPWRRDVPVRSRTCSSSGGFLDVTSTCAFPTARLSGRQAHAKKNTKNNRKSVALFKTWHTRKLRHSAGCPAPAERLASPHLPNAGAVLRSRYSVSRSGGKPAM